MKKTYIYLALGAAAAWWFIKRKKAQTTTETTADERRVVLLELGTETGGLIPYRLTYSDGTKETGLAEYKLAQAFVQGAKRSGAEIRTGVEDLIPKLGDGPVVVKPKRR